MEGNSLKEELKRLLNEKESSHVAEALYVWSTTREALNSERWAGSRVLLFRMDERGRGRFIDLLLGV